MEKKKKKAELGLLIKHLRISKKKALSYTTTSIKWQQELCSQLPNCSFFIAVLFAFVISKWKTTLTRIQNVFIYYSFLLKPKRHQIVKPSLSSHASKRNFTNILISLLTSFPCKIAIRSFIILPTAPWLQTKPIGIYVLGKEEERYCE